MDARPDDREVADPRPALFGKLPAHGDFVCRGLDESARAAWDAWAGAGLGAAALRLAGDFPAAHDAGPCWRFIAGPGALGDGWRAGALAPSIDAVGRRYLAVLLYEGLTPGVALVHGAALSATAERLLYAAVAGLEADAAVADLGDAAVLEAEAPLRALEGVPQSSGVWWTEGGAACDACQLTGAAPPASLFDHAFQVPPTVTEQAP